MSAGDGDAAATGATSEEAENGCAAAATPPAAPTLVGLSNSILTTIMEHVVRCSNSGQVIKLALACRALYRAVSEAEGLWEQLSISHGWRRRPTVLRASTPAGFGGSSVLDLDQRWFQYYTHRMACRRNVRRFFKLYSGFLSRPSNMALMQGAAPAALSAAEQRLGVALPAELWELYRFRNGQAPGAFVTFADDTRLLGLDEVVVERHPGLPELRQRLARMGRSHRGQLPRPGEEGAAGGSGEGGASASGSGAPGGQRLGREADVAGADATTGQTGAAAVATAAKAAAAAVARGSAASGGQVRRDADRRTGGEGEGEGGAGAGDGSVGAEEDGDDRLVVVASNPSSSRRFLVALDGQVYLARGLSVAFFAPGVAAMIQKLLH